MHTSEDSWLDMRYSAASKNSVTDALSHEEVAASRGCSWNDKNRMRIINRTVCITLIGHTNRPLEITLSCPASGKNVDQSFMALLFQFKENGIKNCILSTTFFFFFLQADM